jgi:hypothetical protein
MMKSLVNEIIAPYFDTKKEELTLPTSQCALWMIDCWSVHKSEEFCSWMKDTLLQRSCKHLHHISKPALSSWHWQFQNQPVQMMTAVKASPTTFEVDKLASVMADIIPDCLYLDDLHSFFKKKLYASLNDYQEIGTVLT